MRISLISRRRAVALVVAPAVAWSLRAWPAAAQQGPEVPIPPPFEDEPTAQKKPAADEGGPPTGEQPVQLETKVTTETPVGAQPAKKTVEERPKQPEPYVREKAERKKQERVKHERKAGERKKRERSAGDRSMRRNY